MFKYLASTPETKAIRSALAIALGKPDHGGAYARMLTEFVTANADRFNAWLDTEAILAKAAREGANAPVPPRPHARNALFSALARSRIEAGHRLRHGYPLPLPAPAVEAATAQCAATRAAAEIMTEKACTKPFATWR